MKKLLLFLVLMVLPMMASADNVVEIDGLYYELNSGFKTAYVVRHPSSGVYSEHYDIPDIKIPSSVSYDGSEYRVAGIKAWAFNNETRLIHITIPGSVTFIEEHAFYNCSSLTSITFPNSIHSIYDEAFSMCTALTSVSCYAEEVPTTSTDAFLNTNIENATLYVPASSVNLYLKAVPWSSFKTINGIKSQCTTPTINYSKGQLIFNCETEGTTCYYSIYDEDIKAGTGNEVQLGVTYTISVYAAKEGYINSEPATATLCWIDAEPKKEGITGGIANVQAHAVMIQCNGGVLTIQGADDGTPVSVYNVSGIQEGAATISNGSAVISTNIPSGSIAIVKIGQKSVKVVIK